MPQVISAGILLFHISTEIEVFLTHPGGPYFRNNDVWFIPKGEVHPGEDLQEAARREFNEETGIVASNTLYPLESVRLKSGKIVHIWASETKTKPSFISSNDFEMEWPPHSGKLQKFPESDKGQFFTLEKARKKIHPGQQEFLVRLEALVKHLAREHPQEYNRTSQGNSVNPQTKLAQFFDNKKL